MPSALAVCRLMTNSNLVDCETGRSAGFALGAGRRSNWPSSQWYSTVYVLALEVAGFVEALAERSDIAYGVLGRPATDEADYQRWLLRARRQRPGNGRAAEQRDELA